MTRSLLLLLALAAPAAALEVPFLSGRVNDTAGMLSEPARQALESSLKDFESRTGHQAAVLTVPSLEGEALEDFSLKVSRTWALGRKGQNDGVLFLISKNDRKLRIEVGHGLEGSIPDALAGRIIQDAVVPLFRAGDYEGGITTGVNAIISAADGTYSPPSRASGAERNDFADAGILEKLLISAFVFGILGLFEFVGLVAPGMGWFLYFFLIPFWAAFPMAIWGARIGMGCLMTHLIGFPFIKGVFPYTPFGRNFSVKGGKKVYYGNTEIFTMGGSGFSSGGGGFSSGGGGFSGGGGSFGGGGSSGSW
jgi:uncharacterized protein